MSSPPKKKLGHAPPKRPVRAVTTRIKPPRYLVPPKWGAANHYYGGTSMVVVLGPMAAESVNRGSKPQPNTPPTMTALHAAFGAHAWIAGHLLNEELGGPGINKNLTPLTHQANMVHKGYEAAIKKAVLKARARAKSHPADTFWYGVYYKVTVRTLGLGGAPPLTNVPKGIVIEAWPVVAPKKNPKVYKKASGAPLGMSAFKKAIDNG